MWTDMCRGAFPAYMATLLWPRGTLLEDKLLSYSSLFICVIPSVIKLEPILLLSGIGWGLLLSPRNWRAVLVITLLSGSSLSG